jgi:Ras-related protein Rab-2A
MSKNNNFNYLFKYIIIGDPSVGKSNILMKYTQNKFTQDYQATIGVEFGAKNLELQDSIFRIQIWDTAGQENFRSITRAYYKNSVCALIVYDITNRQSFDNVQNWLEDVKNQSPETVTSILIGNKSDLDYDRKVTYEEGNNLALKNGILFFETSARTGEGLDNIFKSSVEEICRKMQKGFYDLNSESCGIKKGKDKVLLSSGRTSNCGNIEEITLGIENQKKKKNCC